MMINAIRMALGLPEHEEGRPLEGTVTLAGPGGTDIAITATGATAVDVAGGTVVIVGGTVVITTGVER